MLLVVCQLGHLVADGPIEGLDLGTCLEVDDAVAEEVECFLADVFGIVPVLEERARGELVPYLRQVVHQLVVFRSGLEVLGHLRGRDALQHVDDEHAVVSCERASALRDDVGVGDVCLVGCLDEGVDAVVDVFLDAVVHATLAIAGACAVVVDAQAAAAVHELDAEAHGMELHVVLCCLAQGCADAAYLVDLAADVEVYEPQAVAQSELVEHLQGHEELGGVEAELRCVASALAPFAAAARCELDADAQVGVYAELLGGLGDDGQLGQFLDDEEDALAHLLRQQSQFDEVLVLVPVADDEAVGVHVCGEHGVQFGLGACFEAQVVAFAVADDFLHDGPHLVDLDGEDDEVFALVVVLFARLAEAFVGLLNAVVEDVGEAKEYGSRDVACSQLVDDLFQVYLYAVLLGCDIDVPLFVDAKVIDSPTLDVVEFLGVLNAPLFHFFYN